MNRISGTTHALLRIVTGLLFMCHGGQKMLGWFGGMPPGAGADPLLHVAGVIELVGGFLVMIGLLTRPVAFLASGEMAVAYFKAHFPNGFWPLQNHGETAVLFCFLMLFLAGNGAGPWSVDALFAKKRSATVQEWSGRHVERTATS